MIALSADSEQTSVPRPRNMSCRRSVLQCHTSPAWCRSHVGSMKHLSYTVHRLYTRWSTFSLVVDRTDIKTYRRCITLIRPCSMTCCIYVCKCYQMFKISGTAVVQKGTEVDLVVVPKVTSRPLRYRNGLHRGPEHDRRSQVAYLELWLLRAHSARVEDELSASALSKCHRDEQRPKQTLLRRPYCYLGLRRSDAVCGYGKSMTEIQTVWLKSRVRFESNLVPNMLMLLASGTVVPATFTEVRLE